MGFGDRALSGSRFLFWALAPCLLFSSIIVPLSIGEWTPARVAVAAVWSISCILGIFALYDARRFWWATRSVTATIFVAYAVYLIYEFVFDVKPFELVGSRSEASPRNSLLGFVIIGLPCLWYTVFGRFSFRKRPTPEDLEAVAFERQVVVTTDESGISAAYPNGKTESIAWAGVERITIETNDSGPWEADVWWLFEGAARRCAYPQGAIGDQETLSVLPQRFPGFSDAQVIEAMGCTSKARFVCWEKSRAH